MDILEFKRPSLNDEKFLTDYKNEFFNNNELTIDGSALLDKMPFNEWLTNTINNSSEKTVRKDWCVSDTFLVIRKKDNFLIGMVDIRHSLNNFYLKEYWGHIGYSVRPSLRRNGYATQILKKAINYAKSIGILSLMLGCYENNIASIKTIEKCGGRLYEKKLCCDKKPMRVYYIENK